MHVAAQQVAQAVGHEDGSQADPHHVLHVALQDAQLQQLLQVGSVRQQVHVSPLHPWTCQRPPSYKVRLLGHIEAFKMLFYEVVTHVIKLFFINKNIRKNSNLHGLMSQSSLIVLFKWTNEEPRSISISS